MTNEQCITVAEKVWGLDSYQQDTEYQNHQWYGHDSFPFEDFIKAEVNSWQGFGRTVEAMAEKKWVLSDSPDGGLCLFSHLGKTRNLDLKDDYNNPKKLIEATHLAALEALRDV